MIVSYSTHFFRRAVLFEVGCQSLAARGRHWPASAHERATGCAGGATSLPARSWPERYKLLSQIVASSTGLSFALSFVLSFALSFALTTRYA